MKILIIAGSNRKHATSTLLATYVGKLLQARGANTQLFDLYHQPIPLFSPDGGYEQNSHREHARELQRAALDANAFVLSSPEYHGSMTGVMKNALDFLGFDEFGGKAVLSLGVAGGAVAISVLQHMQTIVRYVHGVNCPEWISLGGEMKRFNHAGEPEHPDALRRIERVTEYFYNFAQKLV